MPLALTHRSLPLPYITPQASERAGEPGLAAGGDTRTTMPPAPSRPPRRRRREGRGGAGRPMMQLMLLLLGLLLGLAVVGCRGQTTAGEAVKDYYRVLGVEEGTTAADIKKQYKKLALQYHPDKNPDDKEAATQKFAEVAQAYEVLGNAERRSEYDRARKMQAAGMHGHGHPGGFDHGGGFGGPGDEWVFEWEGPGGDWGEWGSGMGGPFDFHWDFSDPFDIFTSMFGGADFGDFGGMGGMHGGLSPEYVYYDEATGDYFYIPPGSAGDPHAVVYEAEESFIDPATGIKYVRIERVFGDGRAEVETVELPPPEPVAPPPPRRPPPSSFVEPPVDKEGGGRVRLDRLAGVRYELAAGEAPLREGEKLLSTNGLYACFLDAVRGRLVVAEEAGKGRIVWEAPDGEEESDEEEDGDEWGGGRMGGVGGAQLEAVATRDGRLELQALRGGRRGREVLWRSASPEDGGPFQDEDALVSGFRYVLTVDGRKGNLVLRSVPTAAAASARRRRTDDEEDEEEGGEEECVWASRGCPGRGLAEFEEACELLRSFGRRVVSPLFRHARAAARALHAGFQQFRREHGPGIRKGVGRLQGLLKGAGRKLKEVVLKKTKEMKDKKGKGKGRKGK